MGLFDQTQNTKDKKKKITSKEQSQGGAGGAGASLGDASGFGSQEGSLQGTAYRLGVINNNIANAVSSTFSKPNEPQRGSLRDFAKPENRGLSGRAVDVVNGLAGNDISEKPTTPIPTRNKPAIQDITSTKVDTIEGAPSFFKSNFTRENGVDTLSGTNGLGGKYSISSNSSSFRNGKPFTLDDIAKLDQRMTFDSSPAEVARRQAEVNRMNAEGNRRQLADILETSGPKGIADLQKVAIDKAALGDTIAKHQSDVALSAEKNETDRTQQAFKTIADAEAAGTQTDQHFRKSVFNSFGLGVTDKTLPAILGRDYAKFITLSPKDQELELRSRGLI